MSPFKHLFLAGRIGSVELRNRIVMAPMQTFTWGRQGIPDQITIDYFAARGQGGAGLIICPGAKPSRESHAPGTPALYDDEAIPHFQRLTKAVHATGAKVAQQINHTGKALTYNQAKGEQSDTLGPSAIRYVKTGIVLREASLEDIGRITEQIAQAAGRAQNAGFDMVELHAAHGYLLGSFLSSFSNHRTDDYGGSPQNRARFLCQVIKRIRQVVGPEFPLGVRISGSEFLPGGTTIEDTLVQAPLLVQAGASALHISAGAHENTEVQFLSYLWPDAYITDLAAQVRRVVKVPVITVGKLGKPEVAERVLAEGRADFVALGRQFLADPEWPNKVATGRLDDIVYCITCNNCWKRVFTQSRHTGRLYCTVNPAVHRERTFAMTPAAKPRRVAVVGGGLAGMEVARVAALRGHQVTLYEKQEQLGGQWLVACMQDGKDNYLSLLHRLRRQVAQAGVEILTNTEATPTLLAAAKPEVVVLASGAAPSKIPVPGIDGPNVVQGVDFIQNKVTVGDRVVVVGGRLIGMEVALDLAVSGRKVSVATVKRLGENGSPLEENIYRALRNRLIAQGVQIYSHSPLLEINRDGAFLDDGGNLLFLEADTVVLAVGSRPVDSLSPALEAMQVEVHNIGDADKPNDALEAMHQAAELGRAL
ncbi:MAG: FAD-dependent oxidoreductase [Pseudomonadota bacterium]